MINAGALIRPASRPLNLQQKALLSSLLVIRAMSNLNKLVVIEENNDDEINGHRVLKEADQIIIARRIRRTHPRLWREVCRFLSNLTFSCWIDWALLSKAVLVLYNTVYLGSHQLYGKSSQGHSSVDPMTNT